MNKIAQLGRMAAQQMRKQAFSSPQAPSMLGGGAAPNKPMPTGNPFASMANSALQSPLGQGLLNVGANAYNQMPQGARDTISGQAMQWGGLNNQNAGDGSWKMPGFTADPSQGVGINSQTTVTSTNGEDQLDDRLTSMTPGHAGTPWSQLARGAMTGQMPTSTFRQGTPVANQLGIRNDQITNDSLVPQSAFNQQYGGR
jgi:hypothetical protein